MRVHTKIYSQFSEVKFSSVALAKTQIQLATIVLSPHAPTELTGIVKSHRQHHQKRSAARETSLIVVSYF